MNVLSLIVIVCLGLSQFKQTNCLSHPAVDSLLHEITLLEEFHAILNRFDWRLNELVDLPILFPVDLLRTPCSRISSGYGWRLHPVSGEMKLHKGIDIASPCGTPVYCAGNGRVIRSGYDRGYGRFLEVRHAGGFATRYAHLDNVQVRQGDPIRIGEQIATVGHSGLTTGILAGKGIITFFIINFYNVSGRPA